MTVITRFPPSPTGDLHIGSARTALFNWLYARHHGGRFQLRIEDTDRARYSDASVQSIYRSLKWLGLDWDDEIPSQYARRDRHTEVAGRLIEKGQAYYCYASEEELEEMRRDAQKEGRTVIYDRRWRDKDPSEAPQDVRPVIRIKAPLEAETVIHDQVQGEVRVRNKDLDDFVIVRSDGTPTYMLSVVVDDHDMGVTHIIRGDDHLNNAFRQKILFDSMEWDVPVFAHIPLIHGEDGAKMSKRHGAVSVDSYKDMGYLPEAMCNYLLRLGWSHGDDEIIPKDKAVEWFNLEAVGKSPSRFDMAKLNNINAHYIKNASNDNLMTLIDPLTEAHFNRKLTQNERALYYGMMDELKDRSKTLVDIIRDGQFLIRGVPYDFDDAAVQTLDEEALETLSILETHFRQADDFDENTVKAIVKETANSRYQGKMGKVGMPLRAALTGTTQSPSIFKAASVLGKEETCARIAFTLDTFRTDAVQQIN